MERGIVSPRGRLVRRIEGWDCAAAFALARECTERSQQLAVDTLAAAGLATDAEAIQESRGLIVLRRVLAGAFESLEGFPGRVAGYAGDVVQYTIDTEREGADWAACAVYVDAYLAGFVASGGEARHPDHEAAFFDVRRDQSRWFVEHLDLENEV